MTRKRFIRLVMAHGIQRNEAQRMAWVANISHSSYAEAYDAIRVVLVFRRMGASFAAASCKLREAAIKAGESIRTLVANMNAFTGGMNNEDPGN